MEYIRSLEAYKGSGDTAVTLGKFDGLHRGHQKLIRKVQKLKEEHAVQSMAFAFDMLPFFVKKGLPREGLLTNEERRKRLEGQVDILLECPFTEAVSRIEAETFITEILRDRFHARYIVVGTDFTFGYQKRGTPEMLAAYARRCGYELTVEEKECCLGREISSTFIREELKKGHMENVRELLGSPYTVSGEVERGPGEEGSPGTAFRLGVPGEKLLPPEGVYLVQVGTEDAWRRGLGYVSGSSGRGTVEIRLPDGGKRPGRKRAEIRFLHFLRPMSGPAFPPGDPARTEEDLALLQAYFRDERGEER